MKCASSGREKVNDVAMQAVYVFQHDAMRLLEGNVGAITLARESANHSRGAGKVPVELA
jgi:hypothetical protein